MNTPSRKEVLRSQPQTFQNTDSGVFKYTEVLSYITNAQGVVDIAKCKQIGEGGAHLVFAIPNSTAVLKIEKGVLEHALKHNITALNEDLRRQLQEHTNKRARNYQQLHEAYGAENCLVDERIIKPTHVRYKNQDIALDLPLILQPQSEIYKSPEKFDCSMAHLELSRRTKHMDARNLKKMNATLFLGEKYDPAIGNMLLECFPKLMHLIQESKSEPKLQAAIIDFLNRSERYLKESNICIDLVGQDNVIFYREQHNWRYFIGNVIKSMTLSEFQEVLKTFREFPEIVRDNEELRNKLTNGLTYFRVMNMLSLATKKTLFYEPGITEGDLVLLEKYFYKPEQKAL